MFYLIAGENQQTFINNTGMTASYLSLNHLQTDVNYNINVEDISNSKTKSIVRFKYKLNISGEFYFELRDIDDNVMSQGLCVYQSDNKINVTYQPTKKEKKIYKNGR